VPGQKYFAIAPASVNPRSQSPQVAERPRQWLNPDYPRILLKLGTHGRCKTQGHGLEKFGLWRAEVVVQALALHFRLLHYLPHQIGEHLKVARGVHRFLFWG
jgi:hypothetical protein